MTKDQFNEQFKQFVEQSKADDRFHPNLSDTHPVLNEDGRQADWDFVYACHTWWAAKILTETKPKEHIDISSLVYFSTIASAIVPMKFYDLRPINLTLPDFTSHAADLTALPFGNDSVKSLSCMHVLEHCGLGRYGDTLDAQGDLKAAKELSRVLAPSGQLIMVLPVNKTPRVLFNAHRYYTYEQILSMFSGLVLKEFTLIDASKITRNADPGRIRDAALTEYEDCACLLFTKPITEGS